MTQGFVFTSLVSLDTSKATGLDEISPKLLKLAAPIISIHLTKILNLCLITEIFPNQLKVARVTPLLKKGSKLDKSNYRPISILPALSKILETYL